MLELGALEITHVGHGAAERQGVAVDVETAAETAAAGAGEDLACEEGGDVGGLAEVGGRVEVEGLEAEVVEGRRRGGVEAIGRHRGSLVERVRCANALTRRYASPASRPTPNRDFVRPRRGVRPDVQAE